MVRLILLACALIAGPALAGRPMVIRQSQVIEPPAAGGYYFFGYNAAIDGDWAIVVAATPSPTPTNPRQAFDALLYHRVNGQWTLDRTLVRRVSEVYGESAHFASVAMSNGLAAIGSNPTQIFRRTGNTWTEITHPFTAPPNDPDHVAGDLVWDGNTLLAVKYPCGGSTGLPWGARISTLQTDGTWTPLERLSSGDTSCVHEPMNWALSGNTAVAGTWTNDFEVPEEMYIFRRLGSTWSKTSGIVGGDGEGDVRGNEIFFSTRTPRGTLVYRNDDSLTVVDDIRNVSTSYREVGRPWGFRHTNDVFLQERDLFRKNTDGKYEHVATLVASGGPYTMVDYAAISGRRVLSAAWRNRSSSNQLAMTFDLPETYTPSPVIATGFESGPAPFEPQLGTFAVATTANGNRVYRQSNLAGDYRALLGNSDWIEQSIEADIRPTAFSGSNRWAGLAVRYLDAGNYYYVTLRNTGVIELKRMRNGTYATVARKTLPVVAGRNYHVALQAFGDFVRVLVDGREFLWWSEEQPIPHGSAALIGYRTAVDYDNVVAAQLGQRPIFELASAGCFGELRYFPVWTTTGTGTWNCSQDTFENVMQQTSTGGDARATVGTPTDDQIVTTRARATAFAAPTGTQERWFGVAARYSDATNYYYLTVRNSNTVSLRKLVNGTITVLGTAPLTVTPGTWYDLRLDAVGNELRAFVNGTQVLQAADASHSSGQGGILTFKTAAEYENYLAWQP
jgi:hypothetical protein